MKTKIYSLLALILICNLHSKIANAQFHRKKIAVRIGVDYINNFSEKNKPFESITFNRFAGAGYRLDSSFTVKCKDNFIPKHGIDIGIEFRLKSWSRIDINSNLNFFCQGNPEEDVASSKILAIRPGLSTNVILSKNFRINLKLGYSIMESSFYKLYDGDTLHFLAVSGDELEYPKQQTAPSQDFHPSYIALKTSSGLKTKSNTYSVESEMRYFIDNHVFLKAGCSFYWYERHDESIYFSGQLDDGRIKWNDHDIPQAFTERNSSESMFTINSRNDVNFCYYFHIGVGVSILGHTGQYR
jgi:hypothetical protein